MKNTPTKHQHIIQEKFIKNWADKYNKVFVLNLDTLQIKHTYYGTKSIFAQDYFYEFYPKQFYELLNLQYDKIAYVNYLENELNKIETPFINNILPKLTKHEIITTEVRNGILKYVSTQYFRTPEQLEIFYNILKANWKSKGNLNNIIQSENDPFYMLARLEVIPNNYNNSPNTALLVKTIYDILNKCYVYVLSIPPMINLNKHSFLLGKESQLYGKTIIQNQLSLKNFTQLYFSISPSQCLIFSKTQIYNQQYNWATIDDIYMINNCLLQLDNIKNVVSNSKVVLEDINSLLRERKLNNEI